MFSSGGQSFRASLIPDQRSIQIFGILKKKLPHATSDPDKTTFFLLGDEN
jgi:hypothetical protein